MKFVKEKVSRILILSVFVSVFASGSIEVINWYLGFDEFSSQRELKILLTNFMIAVVVGYFYYRKGEKKTVGKG